jgi:hypothetical protein
MNQENPEERGQQVQLIAMVYSKAHRVFVWLGETSDDIMALEDIQRAANNEFSELSNKKMVQRAVINLLRRPWFQRIWVREQTLSQNCQTTLIKLI